MRGRAAVEANRAEEGRKRVVDRRGELERAEGERDRLRRENARLRERNERLEKENARLRQELAAARRAGYRQAAPFAKPLVQTPKRPGRRAGARYGVASAAGAPGADR